jgi:hypothetical protein
MPTLSEELRNDMARCRKLVHDYIALGSVGAFGTALIEEAIRRAEAALKTGNVFAMRRALQDLQRHQGVASPTAARSPCIRNTVHPHWTAPASPQQAYAKVTYVLA